MEAPTPAPAPAPAEVVPSVEPPTHHDAHEDAANKPALTPPTSEDMDKRDERLSSELSDLDSDDGEDIEPDHYWDGGKIPVFKPVRCISRTLATPQGELALAAASFQVFAQIDNKC
jgi:hypothetical protein